MSINNYGKYDALHNEYIRAPNETRSYFERRQSERAAYKETKQPPTHHKAFGFRMDQRIHMK